MVADTRSACKLKNRADGQSSKSIQQGLPVSSSRKIDSVGLRRSTRGAPSKQMTPSDPITHNSEKVPLRTPPSKSKSQRADVTPTLLRRSDRHENPINHDLRQSAKSPLNSKRRKEKTVIQVTMESKQAEIDPEEGRVKRKRISAQRMAYKALFKRKSVKKTEPDVVAKQKQLGQSLHDSGHNELKVDPMEDAEEDVGDNCGEMILCYAREEGIDKVSNGAHPELISDPQARCPVISSDNIIVDTNLSNTVVDGTLDGNSSNGSCNHSIHGEKHDVSSNCGEILDTVVDGTLYADGMNGSCTRYMQDSASPENGDKDMHPREAISGGGITNLQQTCSTCSENERVRDDSPNQEHCSNGQVGNIDSVSTIKDTEDGIAACITQMSKKCSSQVGVLSDGEDKQRNMCASCNKDGELLYCNGKWQCTLCVKKKPLNEHQSKFLEYWVPAQLSNYQLELYCSTLLSNSLYLRSSKNEPFGVLRDILSTVRKSCDHPYLLHSSIQGQLFAELRSAGEILDAGIKASGKLLLLDMMLTEIQIRGFKVLVLYQLTGGLTSLGSILEDFLRQRFGAHTYEHVGAGVVLPKKQAAVNRFNKKEDGQFVFLLENRACSSSIKPLELDFIIMYNSDWNPANDLRTLQKIRIESTAAQIKVFRLYSSCTVEEQALLLSKKNLNIDSSLQTKSRATCDFLLCWGASYLFSKLDEHLADKTTSTSDLSFGALLLNDVTEEFRDIISGDKDTYSNSCISKAQMDVGRYITGIPLAGESKGHLKDGEEPHVFWTNLLNRKISQWKYLTDPSPRNRKRVRYFDTSSESGREDSAPKQRQKVVDKVTLDAGSDGGSSMSRRDGDNCSNDQNSTFDQSSSGTEALAGERVVTLDEQKSLQLLQLETNKLCQILKLSEETALATGRFLEYVSKNHHTHSDLPAIMHAFQISLCWVGASITKQKIDKRESLISAKQLLDYQCTEEQVSSVHLKMRSLKRMYMECSENTCHSGRNFFSAEKFSKEPTGTVEGEGVKNSSLKEKSEEMEVGETTANDKNAEGQILSPPEQTQNVKGAWREINEKIEEIKKNGLKRMTKLVRKHEKEIEEFSRNWEEKRHNLDRDYELESAFIRSIHSQGSARAEKLKVLDVDFSKKIKEHDLLKNLSLKNLEVQQLADRNEEQKKIDSLLAEAESCLNKLKSTRGPQLGSESEEDAGVSQSSRSRIPISGPETVSQASSQHLESNNESLSLSSQRNDRSRSTEAHCCDSPLETSSNLVKSDQTAVLLDCTDLPPQQLCTDKDNDSLVEIPDTGPNEVASPIQPVESAQAAVLPDCTDLPPQQLCTEKDNDSQMEIPDARPNEVASPIQPVESAQAAVLPDCTYLPPRQLCTEKDNDSPMEIPDARPNEVAGPIQPVESAQTAVLPDFTDLPQHQVPQDEVQRDLVPAELQNQDAAAIENNNTSRAPCSTSGIAASINPVLSNVSPPTNETHVAESSEQMHDTPVDVSSHRSPVTEVEQQNIDQREQQNHDDQGMSSLPTMEPDSIEMIAQEPISRRDHPVVESGRSGRDIEPSSSSPLISVGVPVESTYGFQNQNILPGQNNPFLAPPPPPPQVNFRNVGHPYVPDPLQHALEQMEKEAQSMRKKREDKVKELQSDRDKEIQEIMQKYDQKIREVEVEHNLKTMEHDAIMEKIRLNRKLAEAFRYKCLDSRPPGIPQMQRRGFTSGYIPQLHHPTVQSSTRVHPRAPSHQIPLQNRVRSSPSLHQNLTSTPVQNIQPPPTLIHPHVPGPLSRPPVIGSFSRPSSGTHVSGEVRARAPHLQSFNRSNVSSTAVTPPVVTSQAPQLRFPPPPGAGPEQRVNADTMHQNLGSSAWTNVLPSLEPAVGNVVGSNLTSHRGGSGVVCLSDDE